MHPLKKSTSKSMTKLAERKWSGQIVSFWIQIARSFQIRKCDLAFGAVPDWTPIWHSFRGLVFGSFCCLCLFGLPVRALNPSENNSFSKLWRAPDRFDFPTEPDRHNFPIGPDHHHFPVVFYVQHHENWVMLIFMYLSIRPFNDPSLPAVIESSFGFPSMHSSVNHLFVAPTYPLMQ